MAYELKPYALLGSLFLHCLVLTIGCRQREPVKRFPPPFTTNVPFILHERQNSRPTQAQQAVLTTSSTANHHSPTGTTPSSSTVHAVVRGVKRKVSTTSSRIRAYRSMLALCYATVSDPSSSRKIAGSVL